MTSDVIALLPADGDTTTWTTQQKALMQACGLAGMKNREVNGRWEKVAFEAPRDVVEAFLFQCRRTGLDPLSRQIYCIERGGKWGIQISIDGFRLIAARSGEYEGQTAAQWCGPDGVWREVWLDESNPPAAARVGVYRRGFRDPVWGVATFSGYVPRDRKGNPDVRNQWLTNPSNQLAKCGEMLAIRKAYPQELSGLYGTEEMDQATRRPVAAVAEVAEASQKPAGAAEAEPLVDVPAGPDLAAAAKRWLAMARSAKTKAAIEAIFAEAKKQKQMTTELHAALRDLAASFPDESQPERWAPKGEPVAAEWQTAPVPAGEPVDERDVVEGEVES